MTVGCGYLTLAVFALEALAAVIEPLIDGGDGGAPALLVPVSTTTVLPTSQNPSGKYTMKSVVSVPNRKLFSSSGHPPYWRYYSYPTASSGTWITSSSAPAWASGISVDASGSRGDAEGDGRATPAEVAACSSGLHEMSLREGTSTSGGVGAAPRWGRRYRTERGAH